MKSLLIFAVLLAIFASFCYSEKYSLESDFQTVQWEGDSPDFNLHPKDRVTGEVVLTEFLKFHFEHLVIYNTSNPDQVFFQLALPAASSGEWDVDESHTDTTDNFNFTTTLDGGVLFAAGMFMYNEPMRLPVYETGDYYNVSEGNLKFALTISGLDLSQYDDYRNTTRVGLRMEVLFSSPLTADGKVVNHPSQYITETIFNTETLQVTLNLLNFAQLEDNLLYKVPTTFRPRDISRNIYELTLASPGFSAFYYDPDLSITLLGGDSDSSVSPTAASSTNAASDGAISDEEGSSGLSSSDLGIILGVCLGAAFIIVVIGTVLGLYIIIKRKKNQSTTLRRNYANSVSSMSAE